MSDEEKTNGRPGWIVHFPKSPNRTDTYWERKVGERNKLIVWNYDIQYDPAPYHFEFWIDLFKVKGIFMYPEFYRYTVEEAQEECERVYQLFVASFPHMTPTPL